MANFIEYASKAQEELNIELQKITEREGVLVEKSKDLSIRASGLDKKEVELSAKEQELNALREELSSWNSKKLREEDVQVMFDEANRKESESVKKLKESQDNLILTEQKLADLMKRELALSEKEKSYRDEVKQEVMNRFLGVQ